MRPTLSIAAASMAERKNTTSARPVPKSWAIPGNFFDQRPSLMDSFFGNSGFFDSMPSLMGRMLESPFDDFFDTMPAIGAGPVREVPVEKKEDLMSDEKQSRFSYLRQMNALKLAQKKAIHEQDFERAAQLRDEIRELEEAHKEAKENKKDAEDGQ